jgi:adenylosuccinate synthase
MSIVVGLGFGDEGKGLTVSHLASKVNNPLIVRFNGGHQAGHTVVHNNIRHVFSSFGSGTLQNIPTYWSEKCTIYPIAFYNELQALLFNKIEPVFFAHPLCPITTPYDVASNKTNVNNITHGTCGVGFGATLKRHFENHFKLFLKDIFNESILLAKLDAIRKFYLLEKNDFIITDYLEKINLIKKYITIDGDILKYTPIFEGAQGIMLDQDHGFFPHVTRSSTGSKNVMELCKAGIFKDSTEITYVTRTYLTRHGNGPMLNENYAHLLELTNTAKETNVSNLYQGEFRKTILDIDLIDYAIDADMHDHLLPMDFNLMITCIDQTGEDIYVTKNNVTRFINVKNLTSLLKHKIANVYLSYSDNGSKIINL